MMRGFTLVELLVVMGVMAVLLGLGTINLIGVQHEASVFSAANLLISDLRQQQIKAMGGNNGGLATASSSGVYFGTNSYTLFTRASYLASDPNNFVVSLPAGVQFSQITFAGSDVIFASVSGEVIGFSTGSNTVTLGQIGSGEKKTITVNKYGVVTSVN